MSGIEILGTGSFLPEKIVTNNDFAAIVETSDEWITTRTGMSERHIASAAEPTWYMGAQAAKSALEAAGLGGGDIDMILVTTITPDYDSPSTACMIGRAIGAAGAFAFDINVACTGFAIALDMARRYLMTGDVGNVLIVCAETLTQLANYTDRSTCVLFGDGAGASVVRASDKKFASYIKSDGAGAHHVYSKKTRVKNPFISGNVEPNDPFEAAVSDVLFMNGREVYKFSTRVMPEAVRNVCTKLGISPLDLKLIIPHQANARIIETAVKNLGMPEDRIYVNINKYGNTSSASIAIALDECVRDGRINRGDLVCVVGFGAGLVYGASVFEY